MTDPHWTLDELRRKIDEIDDELHDLLMRRTEIVAEIGALKKSDHTPALRPGREAAILRRLMARHKGPLPRPLIVRIWRELLSGTIAMQVDFAVAVFAPDASPGYWDIARDHYGSHTPMTAYSTAVQVLRAVTEGEASVGVLPIPQDGEAEPWWPHLASTDPATPRIIARLPFAGRGNARSEDAEALAIGRADIEGTGADRSLLVIDTSREMSRGRLLSALKSGGFEPSFLAAVERGPNLDADLLELEGIVRAEDHPLRDALRPLGEAAGGLSFLGGYARPLTSQEISAPRKGGTRRRGQVP